MPKLLRRVVKIIFVSLTALSVCISAAAYLVLPLPGLRSYSGPPPILAFDANWGSGFFIDGAGHVITNRHVVTDCRRITVAGWNFRAAPARVVSLPNDPLTDLALLRVDVEPPAALAFSEDPWPAAAAEGQVVSSDQVGGAMRAAAPLSEGRAAMIGYPGDDLGPAPESTSVKVLDTASRGTAGVRSSTTVAKCSGSRSRSPTTSMRRTTRRCRAASRTLNTAWREGPA